MPLPRPMRGRRAAILALTVTMAAGCSAAEGAVTTAGSGNAAVLASAVALPIEIIDDIARGSFRVLNTPRTPPAARDAARALISRGDDLPASVRARAIRAAADTRITAANATAIRERLREHADVILHEIACDLVWTALSPDEEDAVQALTTQGRLVPSYGQRVATSTAAAIGAAGRFDIVARFGAGVRDAVNWVEYGTDVRDKATDLFGPDETVIAELRQRLPINGATYTRALVYHAHTCLRPPR